MMLQLSRRALLINACAMVITAFILRALMFMYVVQPHGYYRQPDSPDYHHAALCIALGRGMCRLDNGQPIFWRTPAYPAYLAAFYRMYGISSAQFQDNARAQRASIWVQIALSSFVPALVLLLALAMTGIQAIALTAGWISAFHIGFILASTYLLTDALASLFFYAFLIFLFTTLTNRSKHPARALLTAALMLALYTWARPMGELIAIATTGILACLSAGSIITRMKHALVFALPFALALAPWYIRNHQYIGEYSFCPMFGIYLNCFSVPKIMRTTEGISLEQAHALAQKRAAYALHEARIKQPASIPYVSPNAIKTVVWPVICAHPGIFLCDGIREIIKSTFDLYASQLVAFCNDSYFYDPMEEFLTEKVAACMWRQAMPWWMRVVVYLELLYALLLWIGLLGGAWLFLVRPLWQRMLTDKERTIQRVWVTASILCSITLGITGGFGYARLRIPIEPLMIILALTFWYALWHTHYKPQKTTHSLHA